jgi:hypothetical protein
MDLGCGAHAIVTGRGSIGTPTVQAVGAVTAWALGERLLCRLPAGPPEGAA